MRKNSIQSPSLRPNFRDSAHRHSSTKWVFSIGITYSVARCRDLSLHVGENDVKMGVGADIFKMVKM